MSYDKNKKYQPLDELKDPLMFISYCFNYMQLPKPAPLQQDMITWMADPHLFSDGKKRCQIQASRGTGKSVMAASLCAWHLYKDPDAKILVVSATKDLAIAFVEMVRKLLEAPLLRHMTPRKGENSPTGKDQTDSQQRFDCGHITKPAKDPSLVAYGMGSNITGTHPDILIADDIEVPSNSDTPKKREKLMHTVSEFEAMIKKAGVLIIQGTPHTEESIYYKLQEAYPIRRWPAEYPDPDDDVQSRFVSPWLLDRARAKPALIGHATIPEINDDDALRIKKLANASKPGFFELQYLLNPSLMDDTRYPLKGADLIVYACDPTSAPGRIIWGNTDPVKDIDFNGVNTDALYYPTVVEDQRLPYDQMIMSVDPSGGGADETGYAVVAACNGMFYILDCGGYSGGHGKDVLATLAKKAKQWGVRQVLIESNFGDGLFTKVAAPYFAEICGPVELKDVRVQGQKEARIIDTLHPLTFSHKLVVDKKVAKDERFMHQYTHITRSRGSIAHDDRIDAVTLGLAALSAHAQIDPASHFDKATKKAQAEYVKAMESDPRLSMAGHPSVDGGDLLYSSNPKHKEARNNILSSSNRRGWGSNSNFNKRRR